MDIINKILSNPPLVHSGETEMKSYSPNDLSIMSAEQQQKYAANAEVCWGIGEIALRFIQENVNNDSYTLEWND